MWQLNISVNKCCVLNTGNPRLAVNVNNGNSALSQPSFILDLGITTASNLSPSTHIRNIVCKANSRTIAIHRRFMSRDITLLVRAYKTCVRPLVESNSVIWSPSAIGNTEIIERIQRNFTKKTGWLAKPFVCNERLKRLNLDSSELRRLGADLIWCCKIIFGLVCLDVNELFVLSTNSRTTGHPFKLFKAQVAQASELLSSASRLSTHGITITYLLLLTSVPSLHSSVLFLILILHTV